MTEQKTSHSSSIGTLIYLIISAMTAMVGYTIHASIFWSIIDFIFTPIALIKWLICHEITFAVIQETFHFFK